MGRKITRRRFVTGTAVALPAAFVLPGATFGTDLPLTPACTPGAAATPAQTAGPFFLSGTPERRNFKGDGDGRPFTISGFVMSPRCEPAPGALIELWHADANGEYDRSGYRFRGHQRTDEMGRYLFETIRPDGYRFRTPHYHLTVIAQSGATLTTQLYFPGEVQNKIDFIHDRRLEMRMNGEDRGYFDFVLSV